MDFFCISIINTNYSCSFRLVRVFELTMIQLVFVFLSLFLFYYYSKRNHDYWTKRNVKQERPLPFFGNYLPILLFKKNIEEESIDLYKKYHNEKFVGFFIGNTPALLMRDPEIIKHVMNLDFNHFIVRGIEVKTTKDSLFYNAFFISGDHWKLLRQRFSSAVSASKLQGMFPLVVKCADKLQQITEKEVKQNDIISAWELMARFTFDFIASYGFGIELDTIDKENIHFLKMAKLFFDKSHLEMFMINLNKIIKFLHLIPGTYGIKQDFAKMVYEITKKVRKERNFKPCGRNDFMDRLLEMEGMGKIYAESFFEKNPDGSPVQVEHEMNENGIAAQVFLFLLAGFETSSLVTSSLLHLLAYHPEIQRDVQKEIDSVLSKYNNRFCYDAIKELKLLDMCFKEAMRIMPPAANIYRVCTKSYTIPGTNVTIDPGVNIIIPSKALHMDPNYFESPNEFRPDRFSPEASKDLQDFVYMPFGEGPRKCPGTAIRTLFYKCSFLPLLNKILHKRNLVFSKNIFCFVMIKYKTFWTISLCFC